MKTTNHKNRKYKIMKIANLVALFIRYYHSVRKLKQIRSNKDASEGRSEDRIAETFDRFDCRLCVADFLQVISRLFAVRDPYLDFSNISMLFLLNFRCWKKKRATDGRTDRPSYRDAWTHLKTHEQ